MMFATLGIVTKGPIDLGSDSNNESRISTDITKRTLLTAGLQELKEINHCIQAKNAELRRLLQEVREEKKRLLHQLQAKDAALEKL